MFGAAEVTQPPQVETPEADAQGVRLSLLLELCASGDRTAFRAFYDETSAKIFGLLITMLRNQSHAEEVMQEVYLQVWRAAKRFDAGAGHPMAWLTAMARNKAVDRLRADRTRGFVAFTDTVPDAADLVPLDAGTDRMALGKVMQDLRPEYRQVLVLTYFYGFTHEELGKALDIPVGTAKTWLRRGLSALKEALE